MTPIELLKKFLEENRLVLSAAPEFVRRDDGTFSIVIRNINVDKLPEPKEESDEVKPE